ncbi:MULTISPECIES: hypothetical protein [Rhodococcus]|uniref:hypothetical protein n=1 Tax=Rhodococcus TaxID=1827 RepID=UPI000C7960F1|nr:MULTISPECIES: hypothetical protein [Rhodococcus]AUM18259.1 hypothetical protein CSW53_18050 [Rhodococcus ruber]
MTTNITPNTIRAAANLIDELFTADTRVLSVDLRLVADLKEREQADEKRIDEYAQISFNAEHAYVMAEQPSTNLIDWDGSSEFQRNVTRAGIRALLTHLEQERKPDVGPNYCSRGACATPDGHEGTCAEASGFVPEPRKWYELHDVPEDVQKVTDNVGSMYRRFKPGPRGWEVHADGTMWSRDMDDDLEEWAPFTEVVSDKSVDTGASENTQEDRS